MRIRGPFETESELNAAYVDVIGCCDDCRNRGFCTLRTHYVTNRKEQIKFYGVMSVMYDLTGHVIYIEEEHGFDKRAMACDC